MKMNENWKNCCRLCGKKDHKGKNSINTLVFTRNNQEIAKKYFSIKLLPLEGRESLLCHDCCSFLTKLDDFERKCWKVDQMFSALISNENFSKDDVQDIRNKFGVDPELEFIPLPEDEEENTIMSTIEEETEEDTDSVSMIQEECLENNPSDSLMESESTCYNTGHDVTHPKSSCARRKQKITEKVTDYEFCHEVSRLMDHNIFNYDDNQSSYTCCVCYSTFDSKSNLRLHAKIHMPQPPQPQRLYSPCPYCKKLFSSQGGVQSHIISKHTMEKRFVCEICGMAFKQSGSLNAHKRVHSDKRPMKCTVCPASFKDRYTLRKHQLTHDGKEHPCPHCDVKCKTRYTLQSHMVVHANVKKYKCKRCGDEFKRSSSLKKHLINHMGLRLYKCQFCGKMYTDGSSCRNHKKKYHPVELAEFEASGQTLEVTRAPRLEWLQSKSTVEEDTNTED